MNILIRDTKKPNKEPFMISEVGFQGLQKQHGGRYVRAAITVSEEAKKELNIIDVPKPAITFVDPPKENKYNFTPKKGKRRAK